MRILLVEDLAAVLVLTESLIEQHGHETFTASSVEQALAVLQSDQHLDVLFTDLALGETNEDGLHLAQEAVRLRPGLRIVYTSGQTLTDGMRSLFVDGSQFLPKPYTAEQLLKAIASIS